MYVCMAYIYQCWYVWACTGAPICFSECLSLKFYMYIWKHQNIYICYLHVKGLLCLCVSIQMWHMFVCVWEFFYRICFLILSWLFYILSNYMDTLFFTKYLDNIGKQTLKHLLKWQKENQLDSMWPSIQFMDNYSALWILGRSEDEIFFSLRKERENIIYVKKSSEHF